MPRPKEIYIVEYASFTIPEADSTVFKLYCTNLGILFRSSENFMFSKKYITCHVLWSISFEVPLANSESHIGGEIESSKFARIISP